MRVCVCLTSPRVAPLAFDRSMHLRCVRRAAECAQQTREWRQKRGVDADAERETGEESRRHTLVSHGRAVCFVSAVVLC